MLFNSYSTSNASIELIVQSLGNSFESRGNSFEKKCHGINGTYTPKINNVPKKKMVLIKEIHAVSFYTYNFLAFFFFCTDVIDRWRHLFVYLHSMEKGFCWQLGNQKVKPIRKKNLVSITFFYFRVFSCEFVVIQSTGLMVW